MIQVEQDKGKYNLYNTTEQKNYRNNSSIRFVVLSVTDKVATNRKH